MSKTWKAKKTICRSSKSGKFSHKGKCGAFKRERVKQWHETLFG